MVRPTAALLRRIARRTSARSVVVVGVVLGVVALPALAPASPSIPRARSEVVVLTGAHAEPTAPAGVAADAGEARRQRRPPPPVARPGWSAFVDVDDGSSAIALSWAAGATGVLRVRGRSVDGWSSWSTVDGSSDEGPDGGARAGSSMVWFGSEGVTDVEVEVRAGTLDGLELQAVRFPSPATGTFGLAPAGAVAAPAVQPRSAWTSAGWATGNDGCASGPRLSSSGIHFAVLHHTVNANTYSAADVPAMLAAIRAFHTGTNGWCDIAYNFVIDRFGRIWEARKGSIAGPVIGGHAQGFNTGSVGIAFLGQHEPGASPSAASPSPAALDAAARLVAWKLGQHGIDPQGTTSVVSGGSNRWPSGHVVSVPRVAGHRDLGLTSCPGSLLYAQLAAVRAHAHALIGSPPPPPDPRVAPFASATELIRRQFADVLHRPPSAAELSFWLARVPASWSPAAFTAHLITSAEADGKNDAVTRAYAAAFSRTPDHRGFTYWTARRRGGASVTSIAQAFASSSEFRNRYGPLGNGAFVEQIYRNVLGRAPDPTGLAYWTSQLAGGMGRGRLLAEFSESSEHVARTESATRVVAAYESLLGRAATPSVLGFAVAVLDHGGSFTSVLASVLASQEYRHRV